MFMDEKTNFQLIMLNEFEKQIDEIFDNFYKDVISFEDCIKQITEIKNAWKLVRIDLKNFDNNESSIKIIEKTDNLKIYQPSWFKDNKGIGYKIESISKNIKFRFECSNSGILNINLRGMDLRDLNKNRIPTFINITSLIINNHIEIDNDTLVCHDKPYSYEKNTDKKEIINIELKFKNIYDYFPMLSIYLVNIKNTDELIKDYKSIKNYINYEKLFIQVNKINEIIL